MLNVCTFRSSGTSEIITSWYFKVMDRLFCHVLVNCDIADGIVLQFSPLTDFFIGKHEGRFSRDPLPVFLQETLVSSAGMGRDVHSLMLSFQHFLCRPRRRPSSKVPKNVLERQSWRVTCPNRASFRLLTVASSDNCKNSLRFKSVRDLFILFSFFYLNNSAFIVTFFLSPENRLLTIQPL